MTLFAFTCGAAFGVGLSVIFPKLDDLLGRQGERLKAWYVSRK